MEKQRYLRLTVERRLWHFSCRFTKYPVRSEPNGYGVGVWKPKTEIGPTGVKINCEHGPTGRWRDGCDDLFALSSAESCQHTCNEAVEVFWRDLDMGGIILRPDGHADGY
jgi:hypothetical protein